jgi:hypothetical protein
MLLGQQYLALHSLESSRCRCIVQQQANFKQQHGSVLSNSQRAAACQLCQASWLVVLAALALLTTLPVGATRSIPLSHGDASTPANSMATQLPQPKKLRFPARSSLHSFFPLVPKPAPELHPKSRGGSKPKGAAAQSSVCTAARSSRKANRCSNAGVTIPACLYSCWNSAHTAETCACCWAGHQLVGNKCEACPVGTYARTAENVCLKCNEGYSTLTDQSSTCNGKFHKLLPDCKVTHLAFFAVAFWSLLLQVIKHRHFNVTS